MLEEGDHFLFFSSKREVSLTKVQFLTVILPHLVIYFWQHDVFSLAAQIHRRKL